MIFMVSRIHRIIKADIIIRWHLLTLNTNYLLMLKEVITNTELQWACKWCSMAHLQLEHTIKLQANTCKVAYLLLHQTVLHSTVNNSNTQPKYHTSKQYLSNSKTNQVQRSLPNNNQLNKPRAMINNHKRNHQLQQIMKMQTTPQLALQQLLQPLTIQKTSCNNNSSNKN